MARHVARLAPVGLVVVLLFALTGYGFAQALTPTGAGGHKIRLMLWYWNRSIDDSILTPVPRSACGRPGAWVLGTELRRASLDTTEFVGQWCVT